MVYYKHLLLNDWNILLSSFCYNTLMVVLVDRRVIRRSHFQICLVRVGWRGRYRGYVQRVVLMILWHGRRWLLMILLDGRRRGDNRAVLYSLSTPAMIVLPLCICSALTSSWKFRRWRRIRSCLSAVFWSEIAKKEPFKVDYQENTKIFHSTVFCKVLTAL